MPRDLFAGVMSGTSLDGVDAVVADFSPPGDACCQTLGAAHIAYPTMLRDELLALQTPGNSELARAGAAANMLAELYADGIGRALAIAKLPADAVKAAGVHGQTLRHRPDRGWTLQLNNPARVAERAGMTVVADFRSRDVAAGGQGAPLVPAYHAALARSLPEPYAGMKPTVFVNVGGMPAAPRQMADAARGAALLHALKPFRDSGGTVIDKGHVLSIECGEGIAALIARSGSLRQWGRRRRWARRTAVAVVSEAVAADLVSVISAAASAQFAGIAVLGRAPGDLAHGVDLADRHGLFLIATAQGGAP